MLELPTSQYTIITTNELIYGFIFKKFCDRINAVS